MADDIYAPSGTEQFDWPPRRGSALGVAPRPSALGSAVASRQAQRDLYDPTMFQPADGGQVLTGAPVHQPGMLGDFGRQVLASTMQMGEGLLGAVSAANVALGGDPEMRAIVDSGRRTVADATRSVIESMSPQAQAAMHSSLFGGTDRHGNATPGPGTVGWGSYIGSTIASVIPTVVLAVVPGAVVGNAVGAMAATGTLFGAIQSGEAYNAFVDALDKATPEQLEQSEVYRELRGRGMSDTDARKEMLQTITPGLAAMQFGIGAATGVGYAHMFGKGVTGPILSRMGVGAAEGAALGALQGGGGNLASQRAEVQAGILGGYDLGDAALTGAAGAIGGAVLGGGAGAVAGRRRPSALKEPPSTGVPADQAAALTEVGPVAPPRLPEQGELFLPYEMGAGPRPGEAAGMPTQQPDLFGGPTVRVTEPTPAFEPSGIRLTGDPSTAPLPPAQREMFPGLPEQRVPAPPDPSVMRQPPSEVPGQLDLPLDPRNTGPQRGIYDGIPMPEQRVPAPPDAVPPEMLIQPPEVPGQRILPFDAPDRWDARFPPTDGPGRATTAPPAEKPARAPRKRATQGEPTAAQPQKQVVSPPAAPVAPAAPAPATRRPSVAPEQGAPPPKATTVVEPAPSAPPVKPEPPATKADIKEAVQGPVVEKVAGAKVETPTPAPIKPQTVAEKLRAKRQAEKARMAATGERQRGVVASVGEDKPDAPPPAAPTFDREAARSAVAKEIVPLKAGADTTRAMNKMLDEIEGILALQTKRGEPDLQVALREWVRSQPDRLPGTTTRPGELADRILRKVEGRSLTDTAENRAAARQEVRQPNVVENERVAKKAAAEEAVGDNVAADHEAVSGESIDESVRNRAADEAAARGETPEAAEEGTSSGVQTYRPDLAAERVSTKNTERVAADLLHDVLQGTRTADEAALAYGGNPDGPGRKRNSAEFADFVEKQVAHYEREATRSRIADELMQAEQARAKATGTTRDRQEASLKVDRLRREYDLTSADNLDAMRSLINDLRHPEIREALAAEQARKKAAKKTLEAEAQQVGVPASVMAKLRQMVSTAERQADVKAMLAVEEHTRRTGFSLTDLAKQMGYDPRAWLEEHQHRMLGKGKPDAERASMYDAVATEASRRQAESDGEREKIARSYGSDMARVEKAQERLDVPDKHLLRAYQWLSENYGDARISANLEPLVSRLGDRDLALPTNRLINQIYRSRVGLHEMLDGIANDPKMQEQSPGLARLAKMLRKKVPDLDVVEADDAVKRLGLNEREKALLGGSTGAYIWDPQQGGLVMMRHDPTSHTTAVHEALHAQADHFIHKNPDAPEVLALARIRQELLFMDGYTLLENSEGGRRGRINYAMENVHETLTMMMTDPTVQGFMARTKASGQLIEDMRALGIDPTVGRPSLWNVFVDWVKKIVGIDPHKDGVTMLDYAMRVGLRTIRAADEWNAVTPEVWQGRGGTAVAANRISRNIATPDDPVGRELFASAKGVVNRAVSASDFAGMGAKARTAVLQAATTDSIVQWNRKLAEPSDRLGVKGNPLVRLRDALENITGAARRYHEQHADTVSELADRLRSKAGQEVASLMNDATLAEVRLGTRDEAANAHLTTPEQQAALREIQGRYETLSDDAKKLYQDTRAYYETTYRAERKARLNALIDAVMPNASEDQRTAILKALRTRAGTEALLTKGDAQVEAAFGNDWTAHRALVRGVAQVHKMGFVRGDYFPLRRYGDYVIRYGSDAEGNYGVEMFERRSEAEARRAELSAQGVDDLTQVMNRRESNLRDLLPNSTIADEIAREAAKNPTLKGQADAVREVVHQVMLEHATRNERVRTQFRRKGVAGAAVDPARVLASEYLASGYRAGHIQHGFDRSRALADLQLVVDDLGRHGGPGEQIRLSQVKAEMEQRLATGDDAQSFFSGFARRATTLGYIQSLMSPSHMVTNTIGVWANAVPMIGARHGAGAASMQLARASSQIAPKVLGQGARNFVNALGKGLKAADWRMSHLARDRLIAAGADREHMTRLFETLDNVGLIDHTQDRELQNIANPTKLSTTGVGKLWQRFMDLNAAGVHAVDVMNKSAVAKAAFDLEFRKNGDVQASIDYAMETLRQAHPNYNLSNRSRIATNKGSLGQFGAPIMQFKAYGLHMYGVLANLTRQSMQGASTAERREARMALAGIIATHAAAAGVVNTIADPLRYIGGAWDLITGASRPRDYQSDVRNFIADIFGPELGEVVARGAPRAIGIDLSNRVGLGNMLAVPELESFDSKGMVKMVGLALMGASGQDAAEIGGGVAKMFQGDVAGGAQQALPRVFRDAVKAYRLSDKGATGPRSQVIIPAEQLSMADILAQAAGFQPAKVAEAREARQAVNVRMMEAREARTRLATKWLEADPADRSGLMGDIREFNLKNPGFTLTVAQLLQMQRDRGKAAKQDFGLRVPPKAGYLRQDARFANVER